MAWWEAGREKGRLPVVFCHGFPELAFSWRHQLAALGAAGRWAIAPDQRGYGLTSAPAAVEAYDIVHLTDDLAALLDHLEADRAVFCGHDWGGIVVWQMALRHPDRTAGVIGVNTPFMARAPADPIEIMRKRFGPDMYIVRFQVPGEADAALARDVAKAFAFFMKRPPKETTTAGGVRAAPGAAADAASRFALIDMLAAYDPTADTREEFLTPEERAVFVDAFSRTGFTGGINWYRNFSRNWRLAEGMADRIERPALMIMAERDAVLPPAAADGMEAFVPDLEKVLIEGSGHWTQQEKPDEVNRAILSWLDRRFPQ
ncbi:MAG TPA: alpha/beta hydrolase [Caulobacteraceae bacterium]|nr:alpha/beta hydrolase [Caulobacteraceae bacterium]